MKTENKQYKLKRWYPSLKKTVEVGCIITKIYTCGGYHYRGSDNEGVIFYVSGSQCENNPDFWELIEEEKSKPLFITEDGVEVFDQEEVYYVTDKLEKINSFINWFTIENMAKDTKIFKHESNADKYIEDNKPKPLFITEDGIEITDEMQEVITVDSDVNVDYTRYKWANKTHLIFGSKDGADKYIWRNKRVFSYEDMMKAKHSIILTDEDIEKAAKKRIER